MLNKNIPTAMKNPNLSGVIIKQDAGLAFAAGAALLYYGVGAPGLERALFEIESLFKAPKFALQVGAGLIGAVVLYRAQNLIQPI
tara:strand:- start:1204 stop:1458 length:255 start_codon:yes stop_codon:yes gene_type:complete